MSNRVARRGAPFLTAAAVALAVAWTGCSARKPDRVWTRPPSQPPAAERAEAIEEGGGPRAKAQSQPIVEGGEPRAEIVVPEQPTRSAKLAAAELQTYVKKISGAELPIVTRPSSDRHVQLYVGRSAHTDRLQVTDEGLEDGAFRMVSGNGWLALLGDDEDFVPREPYAHSHNDRPRAQKEWDDLTGDRWSHPEVSTFKGYHKDLGIWEEDGHGSLNAVYAFLRSLGVRWYFPGELGEIVPAMKTISAPVVDETVRPDFGYRCLYFYYQKFVMASAEEALWQLRLGLNWRGAPGGHGIREVLGHPRTQREHPEYYRLVGGKRDTEFRGSGSPCLSSEGLLRSNVEFARAAFDIYGEEVVSVMPTDGYTSLCQCELCRGKDTPERGYEGGLSDYVWGYVDKVARELRKTHPDRKVSCCPYTAYLLPPEKIERLSPNVVAVICQWRSNFHDPETRKKYADLRRAWLEKLPSKEVYIWDYYLHSRPGKTYEGLPAYFPHIIADDLRSLEGVSAGEFIEVHRNSPNSDSPRHALACNHLNVYVTARLWWDADQDVDALLNEYYRSYYGPASDEMKAFIEYSEANWPQMMKSVKHIDKGLVLLEAARRAAGDAVYGKRVDLVADYVKPLGQLRKRLARGRKGVPQARALHRHGVGIRLDGRLDDKFWEGLYAYRLKELKTAKVPENKTTFKIAWTPTDFYLGIRCEDGDMDNLNIAGRRHDDASIWTGDAIELLIETQVHSYYQIAVNPAGVVADLDRKRGIETKWSSQAEVATHIGEDHWSVEIRVPVAGELQGEVDPLNGVAGRPASTTYPWYFNVCRQRVRADGTELSAFSPTDTDSFHDTMKFGELIFR